MKDIILVTTYLRPEFLYLCLEYLSKTDPTATPKEFWVCADNRPEDTFTWSFVLRWQADVLKKWSGILPIKFISGSPHSYCGNSYNTLESYKRAYNEPDVRYVYLVEDDVLVTPDFFKWHEAAAEAEPNSFCSIAYRCRRNKKIIPNVSDPAAYFTSLRDFASIGVRWSRETISWFKDHACPAYYGNMATYIRSKMFTESLGGDFSEQDGLIERVMLRLRRPAVWAYVPRAFHLGWYGYHRSNGQRPNGVLEGKVSAIRDIIIDPEKVRKECKDFNDIEPYPVSTPAPFESLTKLQHLE